METETNEIIQELADWLHAQQKGQRMDPGPSMQMIL